MDKANNVTKQSTRQKPEILKQEVVAKSRLFRVEALNLRFSNGVEREYERLATAGHGAVMIVPMLNETTVLMIREYAAGLHAYELCLPKGLMESGESLFEAANREMMEEVGYGSDRFDNVREMTLSPGYMGHRISVVMARNLYEKKLEGDEPEPLDVVPMDLSKLSEWIDNEEITEARTIAALYLVKETLGL